MQASVARRDEPPEARALTGCGREKMKRGVHELFAGKGRRGNGGYTKGIFTGAAGGGAAEDGQSRSVV